MPFRVCRLALDEGQRDALLHAKRAGDLLLQAKEQVKHGEWGACVEQHCYLHPDNARVYMKIARHWNFILAKTDRDPDLLPVREARRLLSRAENAPPRGTKG